MENRRGQSFEGSFTAQCKFTTKADKQLKLSDLKDELSKAKRLAARGLSDNYFLFTNARLTGATDATIREAFLNIAGIKGFAAYGADRISLIIRESSRLRMLVPRVYGIGDLSQILDERAHEQAKEILSALGDDLANFVIIDASGVVRRLWSNTDLSCSSANQLAANPPSLRLWPSVLWTSGGARRSRCAMQMISRRTGIHMNQNNSSGWMMHSGRRLDWSSAAEWNRVFPHMHTAIRRGARVLFTSRDYIYHSARQHLKESALPVLRESQVVVHVEQLSKEEREQILLQPRPSLEGGLGTFKSQLKPHLSEVATHAHFSPEIARRLGDPLFTKHLVVFQGGTCRLRRTQCRAVVRNCWHN